MAAGTGIEWTEVTWNPTTGCDRISPGCDHCYALTLAKRLKAMGQPKYQNDGDPRTSGPGFGVTAHPGVLEEPLRWRTPRTVFVNSMSDVGHARISRPFVAQIWAVMALARRHTFQVLTKRPKRLAAMLADSVFARQVGKAATEVISRTPHGVWRMDLTGWTPEDRVCMPPWPLPNVWVGTSIENDDYTWRADVLRRVPASIRFLSLEPLLGPLPSLDLTDIDWVIVGGESGPRFRPLDLDWVRDLRDRCVGLRVPLFFKQVGGVTPKAGGRLLDGRAWDQYPSQPVAAAAKGARRAQTPSPNLKLTQSRPGKGWISMSKVQELRGQLARIGRNQGGTKVSDQDGQ